MLNICFQVAKLEPAIWTTHENSSAILGTKIVREPTEAPDTQGQRWRLRPVWNRRCRLFLFNKESVYEQLLHVEPEWLEIHLLYRVSEELHSAPLQNIKPN